MHTGRRPTCFLLQKDVKEWKANHNQKTNGQTTLTNNKYYQKIGHFEFLDRPSRLSFHNSVINIEKNNHADKFHLTQNKQTMEFKTFYS